MFEHQEFIASQSFNVGDWVTVKSGHPESHCRTPMYLRGKRGTVVEVVGRYHNPSLLALHKPGLPKLWLYRVRFQQSGIWEDYDGSSCDTVIADIYEHWLSSDEEHLNVSP